MIKHMPNERASFVAVALTECPWLNGLKAQLPGYVFKKYVYDICNGVDIADLDVGITIRCFESTDGNYVVELNYGNATEASKQKAKDALEKWYAELYTPRSCKVDPMTGHYPVMIIEYDELKDEFI